MTHGPARQTTPTIGADRPTRWTMRAVQATLAGTVAALGLVIIAPSASAVVATVDLATAGSYSVLGGSTVTNTGPSTLGGDLGLNPGSAITGFPPGLVAGATHVAGAVALQAQSDLTLAYDDAAGRAPTASVAGDLVGRTEPSGVYNSTGPLALSGTLTLDGQGDPSAVFIFQVASTLITASASYINMINGAQACNVFWQVGTSATLGTNSVFRGTIMALASVSVTTGAVVQGRAMARNGAVTLDNNVFTGPGCATGSSATATTTTLTTSPNVVTAGGNTTLTATVSGPSPSGTVTFTSNGTVLGSAPVGTNGVATLILPAGTTVGSRPVTAVFNGSLTLLPSTSAPSSFVVLALETPTLPDTGPPYAARLAATGSVLLLLGIALIWFARRRVDLGTGVISG